MAATCQEEIIHPRCAPLKRRNETIVVFRGFSNSDPYTSIFCAFVHIPRQAADDVRFWMCYFHTHTDRCCLLQLLYSDYNNRGICCPFLFQMFPIITCFFNIVFFLSSFLMVLDIIGAIPSKDVNWMIPALTKSQDAHWWHSAQHVDAFLVGVARRC